MPQLSVRGLAVTRGDRRIFHSLDFDLGPREILHVRGRNGAGKTSLLETLCGLRPPAEGSVSGSPGAADRHWLGHRSALNAALSVLENLQFWCALNGASTQGVGAALLQLGLGRLQDRPSGALSTGQRRRAALARLVAVPRPWWFLDEPLSGLDHDGMDLVAGLLAGHVAQGGSVIVTSHQALPETLAGLRILDLAS